MKKYDDLEKEVEKKFKQKDKSSKPKMRISGKGVFALQKLIKSKNDSISKRKNNKKNR